MRYLRVDWLHDFQDEPVVIYSELNAGNCEVRKVEVLRNGQLHYADGKVCFGDAALSKEPLPSNDEIATDSQFRVVEISVSEFERIWSAALNSLELPLEIKCLKKL